MKYEVVREYSDAFNVRTMCEVLGVKRSNYYRWKRNIMKREERLSIEYKEIRIIEQIHKESDEIYGYRAIAKEMKARGIEISEYRVRRLMRENGILCKDSSKEETLWKKYKRRQISREQSSAEIQSWTGE